MPAGDITTITEETWGTRTALIGTVVGTSSYAAGGFPLNDKDGVTDAGLKFGMSNVDFCKIEPIVADATHILMAKYDKTNDKILVFETGTAGMTGLVEVTDTDDLDALEFRFLAVGRKQGNLA